MDLLVQQYLEIPTVKQGSCQSDTPQNTGQKADGDGGCVRKLSPLYFGI